MPRQEHQLLLRAGDQTELGGYTRADTAGSAIPEAGHQ